MKHHELGPSRLQIYLNCPQAFHLSKHVAADENNKNSDYGTHMHSVVEGKEEPSNIMEERIHQDCVDYLIYVREAIATFEWTIIEELVETTLNLHDQHGNIVTFGTADHIIVYQLPNGTKNAFLIDWKFGNIHDYEIQMKCYSFALMQLDPAIKQVDVRVFYADINKKREHRFTHVDYNFIENIKAIYFNRKHSVYGNHCMFCKAKSICSTFLINSNNFDNIEDVINDPVGAIKHADMQIKCLNEGLEKNKQIKRDAKEYIMKEGGIKGVEYFEKEGTLKLVDERKLIESKFGYVVPRKVRNVGSAAKEIAKRLKEDGIIEKLVDFERNPEIHEKYGFKKSKSWKDMKIIE